MTNDSPKLKLIRRVLVLLSLLLFVVVDVAGQDPAQEKETCQGPVYKGNEVTRRARFIHYGDIQLTEEARQHNVHGLIVLRAILCRTGRVTDIEVIRGLPYGMTENAIQAVRNARFTPAERNWHSVSQRIEFEFQINDGQADEIAPADAEGRIIEAVGIVGNRRLPAKQILNWVRTRPGEKFSLDKVMDDVCAIRASGYFDDSQTHASVEKGVRDGVAVNFEVFELPLIIEVKFQNLKQIDEAVVFAALSDGGVDLRTGQPYRIENGRDAIRIITRVLASHGQPSADAELQIEYVSGTEVKLTFVIR